MKCKLLNVVCSRKSHFFLYGFLAFIIYLYFVQNQYKENFARPLETDEIITIKYYTCAGIQNSGEQNKLNNINDFQSLNKPDLRTLILGAFCSFGRWAEPNNHIINSALLNIFFYFRDYSETTVRYSSFLGLVLFAFLFTIYLNKNLNFGYFATLISILMIILNPFLLRYSVTARGYIWMLVLQSVMLVSSSHIIKKPFSIKWISIFLISSVLTIFNIISMLIFWVLPFFVSLYFYSGYKDLDCKSICLKKSIIIQFLILLSIIIVFFVDRLPFVYSSSNQYGYNFNNIYELFNIIKNNFSFYFPIIGLKLSVIISIIGYLVNYKNKEMKFTRLLMVSVIILTSFYTLFSKKIGYERVYGFMLPMLIIGIASVIDGIGKRKIKIHFKVLFYLFIIIMTFFAFKHAVFYKIRDFESEQMSYNIKCLNKDGDVYTIISDNIPETIDFYFPKNWKIDFNMQEGKDVQIGLVTKKNNKSKWDMGIKVDYKDSICGKIFKDTILKSDNYTAIIAKGKTVKITDSLTLDNPKVLFFWQPSFDYVNISSEKIEKYLNEYKIKYLLLNKRYMAKLHIYNKLNYVVLFSIDNETYEKIHNIVIDGLSKFGGNATLFIQTEVNQDVQIN